MRWTRHTLRNCLPLVMACMVAIQAASPVMTGRCDAIDSSEGSCCQEQPIVSTECCQRGSSSCCDNSGGCCCGKQIPQCCSTTCSCDVQQPVPLAPRDSETTQTVRQLLTKIASDSHPLLVASPGLPDDHVSLTLHSVPSASVNTLLCVWLT